MSTKKKPKDPLAFRVLDEDKKDVIQIVHEYLKTKGYKFYGKKKTTTKKSKGSTGKKTKA